MLGSAVPVPPNNFNFPNPPISNIKGPAPTHLITTATALRLGSFLHHHRLHLRLLLHSSFKNITLLGRKSLLKDIWRVNFVGVDIFQLWSCDAVPSPWMSLFFFNGNASETDSGGAKNSRSKPARGILNNGRQWTNILLAINVLVYIAQISTHGKILFWGAKINSLIDQGQLWRLVTSSLLHANIGHLMINSYSLNSIGPAVESICGPRRYLSIYISSAITSSAMSYWFCKAPAVGASGAIFGLVGSFAVFVLRHRGMVKGTEGDLQHILQVIVLNMVIGYLSKGIDNWGHLGGLAGGAAVSWLLGPAWKLESTTSDGRRVFADKAPIFSLIKNKSSR